MDPTSARLCRHLQVKLAKTTEPKSAPLVNYVINLFVSWD